jgi:hypothetical protein
MLLLRESSIEPDGCLVPSALFECADGDSETALDLGRVIKPSSTPSSSLAEKSTAANDPLIFTAATFVSTTWAMVNDHPPNKYMKLESNIKSSL